MRLQTSIRSVASAAIACLAALPLLGCERYEGSMGTKTNAEMRYDTSSRLTDLLAQCSVPSAMQQAAAASAAVSAAAKGLIDIVNTHPAQFAHSGGWGKAQSDRMAIFDAAQAQAYDAAVACGLVAPGFPDPGSWNATWYDISS